MRKQSSYTCNNVKFSLLATASLLRTRGEFSPRRMVESGDLETGRRYSLEKSLPAVPLPRGNACEEIWIPDMDMDSGLVVLININKLIGSISEESFIL